MEIEYIDTDYIIPNENQPRKTFDSSSLEDLKASIKRNGVIQPIILKKLDCGYRIVAGERRWRAAMDLNMDKIPSIVLDLDSEKEMEISIIENLQREDLNPIEEAIAYKRYLEKTSETQENLAEILGKSRSYISNSMRLLLLSDFVIEYIRTGKISSGHGRAILSLRDEKLQNEIAERVFQEKMSVRELEKEVNKKKSGKKEIRKKEIRKKEIRKKDIFTKDLEDRLTEVLGNKVSIKKGKEKSRIEIEFSNDDQLEYFIKVFENKINT